MRNGWHLVDKEQTLILSRRVPVRFDIAAATELPALRRRALAHEIRKDVWRALRDIKGFSPIVEVTCDAGQLRVRAGGRCDAPPTEAARARLAEVLACPARRARWIRHAGRGPC